MGRVSIGDIAQLKRAECPLCIVLYGMLDPILSLISSFSLILPSIEIDVR